MGIFQRYVKKDNRGNPITGKDGNPQREGPWFVQYPHSRDPETGKIKYRTEKASFSKKKAEKIFRAKVDAFQEMEQLGVQVDPELSFSKLMDWGLEQDVMSAKASASDDLARAVHLKAEFGNKKAAQITPLMVDNFRIKMKKTVSERTDKPFSGSSINKMVSLADGFITLRWMPESSNQIPLPAAALSKRSRKVITFPIRNSGRFTSIFRSILSPSFWLRI